ncbi:MAG: cysteine desulfurase [Subdoligranulum sp.]|nr:cysteine desulfurase [Subdoligranulum sp.]
MLLDPELHYLDNAATTMVDPEIAGAIHEALLKDWANPSSLYEPAVETHEALTTARGQIARTLGCQAKDLYFTSCGSESNNLAVQGLAMARKNWGSKIVVSGFEHPSVQRPIRALKDRGFEVVEILPEADGHLDVAKLAAEVDKNTVLVSCMAVNNETGTLQDIAALSTAVKAKNSRCAVHVDAVQAWLRIPIDLKKWKNVDTLSVSGHKVHAPKGIGALFIRDSVRQTLCPPYLGGHQERGLRPGTENVPYAVGLGVAAQNGAKTLKSRQNHMAALNRRLRAGLAELDGITVHSPDNAVVEVVNFSTGCVNSQTFINYLAARQIYVSGGSACDKGEPSHTLTAMGLDDTAVRTALRVSFCADNTEVDVDVLLAGLRDGLRELQHI